MSQASHGLSARELGVIRDCLAPYAARIEEAGLFGSRATGTAREGSDIDLALFGALTHEDVWQLRMALSAAPLLLKTDVVAYAATASAELRAHIDAVFLPLFTGEALRRAAV